jgi:type VI protein secretion system component Hcp
MILLSLGDIKGDSQITGFTNWISCTQISWDLTREFKESAKAGTKDVFTGVADVKPITLNKTFDCASPDLMQYACGGGKICDTATISLIASGTDMADASKNVYLTFKLDSPMIAAWNISGGEDERPAETLSLWYYKVCLTYWQFDGTKKTEWGPRGWDRIGAKKWTGS